MLEVQGLKAGYGLSQVLFDMHLSIEQGQVVSLIGRNGMHRYNNQDHSMLTAKEAARQIATGTVDKAAIWGINVDDEYHEEVDKSGQGNS